MCVWEIWSLRERERERERERARARAIERINILVIGSAWRSGPTRVLNVHAHLYASYSYTPNNSYG